MAMGVLSMAQDRRGVSWVPGPHPFPPGPLHVKGTSGREKGTSPWGLMGSGWRSIRTEMFPANATSLMRSIHLRDSINIR